MKRLQGTDGLRAPVTPSCGQTPPLTHYLETGLLSPEFVELYLLAFGKLLLEQGLAQPGQGVALGWDPRDPELRFVAAASRGLAKAGLVPWELGLVPTPMVPYFVLQRGLAGGVMLTASHNPAAQNGIKLFLPFTGAKLLPVDDLALCRRIYDLAGTDWVHLPLLHPPVNAQAEARKLALDLHLPLLADIDPAQVVLGLDASKGALATLLQDLFPSWPGEAHLFCLEGEINQQCGVAELEGHGWLSPAQIQGGAYQGFAFLAGMLALTRHPLVTSGEKALAGLVFDGDGDRCFRLDWLPEKQAFKLQSGDGLGMIQARALAAAGQGGLFAHTIESDLMLSQAVAGLGLAVRQTLVGDKWILQEAWKAQTLAQGLPLPQGAPSSLALAKTWQRFWAGKPQLQPAAPFLGIEESGHGISPLPLQSPWGQISAFAGNGLQAGLQSLAVLPPGQGRIGLPEPFPAGLCKTFYVYQVDKTRLLRGSGFLAEFLPQMGILARQYLDPQVTMQGEEIPGEDDLTYIHLRWGQKRRAAAFLRNSGTEDKSALYLRGPQELAPALLAWGEALHQLLLAGLKEGSHPKNQATWELLHRLAQGQPLPPNTDPGLLGQLQRKEGLLEIENGLCRITAKGLYLSQRPPSNETPHETPALAACNPGFAATPERPNSR